MLWPIKTRSQSLTPINTHRPTQGINTSLVEPGALQVESGFELYMNPPFKPKFVLQPRLGLNKRMELFWTGQVEKSTFYWRWRVLSFSPKVQVVKHKTWQMTLVGWGYLPVEGSKARGELGCLTDFFIGKQGVLTLHVSGQAGPDQSPGYFTTVFYTQGIGTRFSTWVEVFSYWPGPTHGAGSGLQYLFGRQRLGAVDFAFNYRTGKVWQILVGLSKKGQLFRRNSSS